MLIKRHHFFSVVILSAIGLLCATTPIYANSEQMNETLVRIIHQLQAIKPLIAKAEEEQPQNPRVKVHFDRFQDANGEWHNGLLQDITEIEQALKQIVNQEGIEPRSYSSMKDDFINSPSE